MGVVVVGGVWGWGGLSVCLRIQGNPAGGSIRRTAPSTMTAGVCYGNTGSNTHTHTHRQPVHQEPTSVWRETHSSFPSCCGMNLSGLRVLSVCAVLAVPQRVHRDRLSLSLSFFFVLWGGGRGGKSALLFERSSLLFFLQASGPVTNTSHAQRW